MGFIERLKQEKLRQQDEAKRRGTQETETWQRTQLELSRKREFIRDQHDKAKKFYVDSRCGVLLNDLASVVSGRVNDSCYRDYRTAEITGGASNSISHFNIKLSGETMSPSPGQYERELGSYIVFLIWETDRKARSVTENLIAIEACGDGSIQFHSGLSGAPMVREVEWRNNSEILESVLEKSYHHPIRRRRSSAPDQRLN